MSRIPDTAPILSRRTFLGFVLGSALVPRGLAAFNEDEAEIARVKKIAEAAGIKDFGVSTNERYLALGNASKTFRAECLKMLLGLSRNFMEHFAEFKGFDLNRPKGRLTVIMVADRGSFAKYLGTDSDEAVAGIYDPNTNDLLCFDNRGGKFGQAAAKVNTMVLTHEATHQLCFNTGLLRRDRDVPLAIAEGLATYAEIRSLDGKTRRIGDINDHRIVGYLAGFQGASPTLPPIESLIRDDERLDAKATQVEAYAEAWLLVHFLMKTDEMLPKFRDYLKAIQKRDDPSHRMDDWTAHFGDTAKFDKDLTKYLRTLKVK